jgi:hypothetical protein
MTELFWIGLGVLLWVGCGVLNAGWIFAHYQRKFPEIAEKMLSADFSFARTMFLAGPAGTLAAFLAGQNTYGWLWPSRKRK